MTRSQPTSVLIAVFAVLLHFCASAGASQLFPNGTVGEKVQSRVADLSKLCFSKDVFRAEFIPTAMTVGTIGELLNTKLSDTREIPGVGLSALMADVYPGGAEQDLLKVMSAAPARPQLLWDFEEATPSSNVDSAVLRIGCGSLLKAGIQNQVSIGLPWSPLASAEIKSAIDTDADVTAENSLVILYGLVKSPYAQALDSELGEKLYVTSNVAAWAHYFNHPGDLDTARYLRGIHGFSIATGNSTDVQGEVNVTADATYKLWVANGSAAATDKKTYKSSFWSRTYNLYLVSSLAGQASELKVLPKLDGIQGALQKSTAFSPPYSNIEYTPNAPFPMRAEVHFLPGSFCDQGSVWDGSAAATPAKPLTISDFEAVSTKDGCLLSFNVTVPSGVTALQATFEAKSRAISGQTIKLVNNYSVHEGSSPLIYQDGKAYVTPVPDMGTPTISVMIPYRVLNAGTSWSVEPNLVAAKCGTQDAVIVQPATNTVIPASQLKALGMMFSFASLPTGPCTLSMLHISLNYLDKLNKPQAVPVDLLRVPFELPSQEISGQPKTALSAPSNPASAPGADGR